MFDHFKDLVLSLHFINIIPLTVFIEKWYLLNMILIIFNSNLRLFVFHDISGYSIN